MIGIKPAAGIVLVALAFTAMALPAAEERMRTGLWEVSTSVDKQAPTPRTSCYTPAMVEQANLPEKTMREETEKILKKGGCTLKDFKLDGHSVSMSSVCPGSSVVSSSTYSGDAFETVATSIADGVTRVSHIKGRRVGECK
jgi:Protein of unknown function (DUF3617)